MLDNDSRLDLSCTTSETRPLTISLASERSAWVSTQLFHLIYYRDIPLAWLYFLLKVDIAVMGNIQYDEGRPPIF